jgi:hypothetical protein
MKYKITFMIEDEEFVSKPIEAIDEDEAAEKLQDYISRFEGYDCDIIFITEVS